MEIAKVEESNKLTRVVILGGGFGGMYTAMGFERLIRNREDIEVILINRENFFLFTPMLHEVAASELDPTAIVNPIHKLIHRVRFFCGGVDRIDLARRVVHVSHGQGNHPHELAFDHLVLGMGSVTQFFGLPGLAEHALTMRTLGDALKLRNRLIGLMEEADFECCAPIRKKLLTCVVAGGGFAGVETMASIFSFVKSALGTYPRLAASDLRFVLVHSGTGVLPELDVRLGAYAGREMASQGIELRLGLKVTSYSGDIVTLSDGTQIEASTLVWTTGNGPNPLIEQLDLPNERGRVLVNENLKVAQQEGLWAVGDCAAIPNGEGGFHPPTAQHALRQGRLLAHNIIASIDGLSVKPFRFRALGQLAALGHHRGVTQIFGMRITGFLGWALWRMIYLSKLPRWEKRFRVLFGWMLDLFFTQDTVQIPLEPWKEEPGVGERRAA